MPKRIRRQRIQGWRMPPNTIYVGRPSRWANPWPVENVRPSLWNAMVRSGSVGANDLNNAAFFNHRPERLGSAEELNETVSAIAVEAAVRLYRALLDHFQRVDPAGFESWVEPLRGKHLACWCTPDQPCHADVLLEIVNC